MIAQGVKLIFARTWVPRHCTLANVSVAVGADTNQRSSALVTTTVLRHAGHPLKQAAKQEASEA